MPLAQEKDVKEILSLTANTPLEGIISENVISMLLGEYDPKAHQEYSAETNLEGIKRLVRWTTQQMSNPKATPIANPIAFLRASARNGMNKPCDVLKVVPVPTPPAGESETQRKIRDAMRRGDGYNTITPEMKEKIKTFYKEVL